MAYQFTEAPVQGHVDTLPNGRKMQFNEGCWQIFSNTLPTNVSPTFTAMPPIISGSTPPLPNANPLWFDTKESTLFVQMDLGGDLSWQPCAPAAPESMPIEPIYSDAAPDLPSTNGFWFQPSTGVLFVQKNLEGTYSWERSTPASTATAPLESESAPVLPNANPFWFKPSTSVLHYQYNDGNSTQWVEI